MDDQVKHEPTVEDIKEVLARNRKDRVDRCRRKLEQALKEEQCALVPQLRAGVGNDGNIEWGWSIDIVPLTIAE